MYQFCDLHDSFSEAFWPDHDIHWMTISPFISMKTTKIGSWRFRTPRPHMDNDPTLAMTEVRQCQQ